MMHFNLTSKLDQQVINKLYKNLKTSVTLQKNEELFIKIPKDDLINSMSPSTYQVLEQIKFATSQKSFQKLKQLNPSKKAAIYLKKPVASINDAIIESISMNLHRLFVPAHPNSNWGKGRNETDYYLMVPFLHSFKTLQEIQAEENQDLRKQLQNPELKKSLAACLTLSLILKQPDLKLPNIGIDYQSNSAAVKQRNLERQLEL